MPTYRIRTADGVVNYQVVFLTDAQAILAAKSHQSLSLPRRPMPRLDKLIDGKWHTFDWTKKAQTWVENTTEKPAVLPSAPTPWWLHELHHDSAYRGGVPVRVRVNGKDQVLGYLEGFTKQDREFIIAACNAYKPAVE